MSYSGFRGREQSSKGDIGEVAMHFALSERRVAAMLHFFIFCHP